MRQSGFVKYIMDQISSTLYWLKGYANQVDEDHDFSLNAMLYFRKTKSGKYVVINHFNRNKKIEFQGFDSWLCEYYETEEPGRWAPKTISEIKLGLKLPDDLRLLEAHY